VCTKSLCIGEIDDPSFFFAWWEPRDPDADFRDPKTWRQANPGYGDLVSVEDFATTVLRTPEAEFRTKRCNQFTSGLRSWLPVGAWDACADPNVVIEPGAEVVLGFDGSFNNDSTAIVVASCDEIPHLEVVACWQGPAEAGPGWAVPIADVEETIRDACRRYYVREIVCDPFRWARTLQALDEEGLPVVEYPQSPARMTPATQRFYEAVMNRQLTHSGDPQLGRHMDAAVLKVDTRGQRIVKESKHSGRRIDLAIAAVMAFDRASVVEQPPMPAIW
jgi:phage terminase large subunit-like protein